MRRRLAIRSLLGLGILAGLFIWACGGGSSPTGPSSSGGNTTEPAATVTITASGASPAKVTVPSGGRVLYINNDSAAHWVASDPHPSHEDCPELNAVGVLQPGERRTSGNLVTTRSCGFHDHDNPGTRALQGTVTIQ
jgi:plastocyanin